jgi:hypothetical protein
MVDMAVMIFLVGTMLGVLGGGALCVRYVRQEVLAGVVPLLRRMQVQLDNLEAELNLALVHRLTELSTRRSPEE